VANNSCPFCGSMDLRAEQTKVLGQGGKDLFDIFCRKCGQYISTGHAIDRETGRRIRDAEIRGGRR